jgi:tetratricopeptide (TPR) repeat protein
MLRENSELLKSDRLRYLYEDIHERRASAFVLLGRYSEALSLLRDATFFSFKNTDQKQRIHLHLGICYSELGENTLAQQEFLRVIDFGLGNALEAQARYRVAIVYFNIHAFVEAKSQLQAILQTFPSEVPDVPREFVYKLLSRTCHFLGEERNAQQYLKLAHKFLT